MPRQLPGAVRAGGGPRSLSSAAAARTGGPLLRRSKVPQKEQGSCNLRICGIFLLRRQEKKKIFSVLATISKNIPLRESSFQQYKLLQRGNQPRQLDLLEQVTTLLHIKCSKAKLPLPSPATQGARSVSKHTTIIT